MWYCCLLSQIWLSEVNETAYGARIGLSYQLGTQGNRVGLNAGVFGRSNKTNTELFLAWSGYRNFSHIETNQPGWENQTTLGLTQGFGGERSVSKNYDWSLGVNNTNKANSLSLYTTIYSDTYDTDQRVLGINLTISDFNIRFEDDYDPTKLLGDYGDRYRTGALEVGYRLQDRTRLVAGFNTFTGDPEQGGVISPQQGASGKYGDYSMLRANGTPVNARDRSIGNAYLGVRGFYLEKGETETIPNSLGLDNMQFRVGWSNEEIRNLTQNSLHDLIRNPRIPLRDVPGKPYFQFGTNHGQTLYP